MDEQNHFELESRIKKLNSELDMKNKELEENDMKQEEALRDCMETIIKLQEEIKEKDKFIQRLRLSSQDLQDMMADAEHGYIKDINDQKRTISELKEENLAMMERNQKLIVENESVKGKIDEMTSTIEELVNIRRDMIISIETLEQETKLYMEEVKQLKSEKQFKNKISVKSSEKENNQKFKSLISNQHYSHKRKILLVTTSHGRDLAYYMSTKLSKYSICSLVKSGADDRVLVHTALEMSEKFTSNDMVILWTKEVRLNLIKDFIESTQHTRTVIISQPYRYDIRNANQEIYKNNLNFLQAVHRKNIKTTRFLDSNNILRKKNYASNGYNLNKNAKFFIAAALNKLLEQWDSENKQSVILSENQFVRESVRNDDGELTQEEQSHKTYFLEKTKTRTRQSL